MILDASPASRSKQRAEPPGRKMRKEERQEGQRMGGSFGPPNGNKKKTSSTCLEQETEVRMRRTRGKIEWM